VAGDWIKMRSNLWDDPRIGGLCDLTGQTEAAVIGGLYWLWATADQHSEDGHMPGLTLRQIDRKTCIAGFGAALVSIGWLSEDGAGVVLARFEEHNGASAKRRCTDAQRKANVRSVSAPDADKYRTEDGQKTPNLGAREEKRREEEPPVVPQGGPKDAPTIPCPYERIVSAYHEALPELPKAKLMPVARQRAMRKLWGWVLSSSKSDGTRRATDTESALAWIRGYFEHASRNDFLMGRTPRSAEHANWQCDIDFLMTEKGMKQVIEKTQEAA
jgi:hypothetical protein